LKAGFELTVNPCPFIKGFTFGSNDTHSFECGVAAHGPELEVTRVVVLPLVVVVVVGGVAVVGAGSTA
jgi:hypothetical protein